MSEFDQYYVKRWKEANLTEKLGPSKRKRLSLLLEYLHKVMKTRNISRFLDYGCGSSWLYQYLKDFGYEYHIYDVTPTVVKIAKEKFPEVIPWYGNGNLPSEIPSDHFDFVSSIEVIEHVPFSKKADFLKDVHRVLKKDAYYFLTTPNADLKDVSLDEHEGQPVEDWTSMKETRELLTGSGFRVVDFGSWYFKPNFSLRHRLFFNKSVLKVLKRLGLREHYLTLLGRTGLGLSLYFLCQATKRS